MTCSKCDACGRHLLHGIPRIDIGPREFCGPVGTDCHTLGVRSAAWTLTESEAAELLYADAGRLLPATLRRGALRPVDHHDAVLGERGQHVAA